MSPQDLTTIQAINAATGYPDLAGSATTTNVGDFPSGTPTTDTTATTTTDPYAQYGGLTAYNNLVSTRNTEKGALIDSAGNSINNAGSTLGLNILDLLNNLGKSQNAINNQSTQAELAKSQGSRDILGMVSRGVRSAGVTLGNRNAANSSAAEQIARAYGELGKRQQASVNSQYGLAENNIGQAEAQLNADTSLGVQKLRVGKEESINQIVSDARTQLANLDSRYSSLPDRINVEAEKEQIRQDALSRLQQYDQQLSNVNPTYNTVDQARAAAAKLASEGGAPENPFNYTSEVPLQFQGTGATPNELPLFTLPRKKV